MKTFFEEVYTTRPRRNYPNNKTKINHIDDTWSMDLLDLNDYGPENNRGDIYTLVVIDNISKFG